MPERKAELLSWIGLRIGDSRYAAAGKQGEAGVVRNRRGAFDRHI
jgi:hypothetical protein